MHFIREMQFWRHYLTVVSYQALFLLSVYYNLAIYLSVQIFLHDTGLRFNDLVFSEENYVIPTANLARINYSRESLQKHNFGQTLK